MKKEFEDLNKKSVNRIYEFKDKKIDYTTAFIRK